MPATPKIKDLLYEIAWLKKELAELKVSKPYGLVWEDKPEQFENETGNSYPVLIPKGGKFKDVKLDVDNDDNVLIEGDNYHALSMLAHPVLLVCTNSLVPILRATNDLSPARRLAGSPPRTAAPSPVRTSFLF